MGPKRTKSQLLIKTNYLNHKVQQPPMRVNNNIDKENFKFISEEYSKYLKCPLCKELMIRPMRFHPCAHTFCQACIQYMTNLTKKYCPLESCLANCVQIQNDRTAESLIDELKVACTNQGCKWKGQYENYKKSHRDTCPLKGMGLDKYLQELRRIPIRPRMNLDFQLQDSQKPHQFRRSMTQSQIFLRSNTYERQENHEKIEQNKSQESQNNKHAQSLQQYQKQILLEKDQNNDQKEKQQVFHQQIQAVRSGDVINTENEPNQNDLINSDETSKKKEQKSVEVKLSFSQLPEQIQLEISSARRIQNNTFILNLPFGPSFQPPFNQNSRRKSKYAQKELKKLQ